MKHLKKEIINDIVYNFYEGGDFNAILNHNKNGQDGIMYIFIEIGIHIIKNLKDNLK